jgi:hypothetical protein
VAPCQRTDQHQQAHRSAPASTPNSTSKGRISPSASDTFGPASWSPSSPSPFRRRPAGSAAVATSGVSGPGLHRVRRQLIERTSLSVTSRTITPTQRPEVVRDTASLKGRRTCRRAGVGEGSSAQRREGLKVPLGPRRCHHGKEPVNQALAPPETSISSDPSSR